jgi:predicted nucleic acid-binding protein
MNKFLLDAVIYIDFFRADRYQEWVLARPARIYLSSIVLLELYTGAHDAAQIQWIDNHLRLPFRARERIVSPMVNDYTRAGQILAELQRTKGYDLRKSYGLQNDVLIALTAR